MRTIPLILLTGCLIGPSATRERLDQDEDGALWPDDCDDSNGNIFPGATEEVDGVDNDCDDRVDEASGGDTGGGNDTGGGGDTGGGNDTGDTDLPPLNGTTLLEAGSVWHYLDANDPPSIWLDPGYNFSLWPSGPGELGYGDGDESTRIWDGGGSRDRRASVAFMRLVEINGTLPATLAFDLTCDDGAVIYVNGSEVTRHNMPSGAISFTTLANSDVEGAKLVRLSVDSSAFAQGSNVIAATVHQVSTDSSDLSFDLEIIAPD